MKLYLIVLVLSISVLRIYSDSGSFNNHSTRISAVYFPGWNLITRSRIDTVLSFCVDNGLNTIIVDIKNVKGEIFYVSKNLIVQNINSVAHTADGVTKTIDFQYLNSEAKKKEIRIVGRFVMFRDEKVFDNFPEYRMEQKEKWIDLRNQDIQNYTLDLLKEVSKLPIDEIALDYIRFPDTAGFGTNNSKIIEITNIVSKVSRITKEVEIDLSVFVFGWVAWNRKQNIGQCILDLAPHVDVIYPMLYPSHFYPGSLGFDNPSDHPYEIIEQGYNSAVKLSIGKKIIPMLQVFWYSPDKVLDQLKAVYDNNMPGFGCWNAAGNYKLLSDALKLLEVETK